PDDRAAAAARQRSRAPGPRACTAHQRSRAAGARASSRAAVVPLASRPCSAMLRYTTMRLARTLIGMVHLQPLPGSPRWQGSMARVIRAALADARSEEHTSELQ